MEPEVLQELQQAVHVREAGVVHLPGGRLPGGGDQRGRGDRQNLLVLRDSDEPTEERTPLSEVSHGAGSGGQAARGDGLSAASGR